MSKRRSRERRASINERRAMAGQVESRPDVNGGDPTFAGTVVRVSYVAGLVDRGWTHRRIIDLLPELDAADIDTARRFL